MSYAEKGLSKGKLTAEQAAEMTTQLIPTLDYLAIAGCDWVLEAATENRGLKREIFARIEATVRPATLITSNTSSLPTSRTVGR
jgi:enoyl-CoA hydratase / 3-hydroxyacyl-CoA dehydrogenase